MALCAGIKRDGGRCTATVPPSKGYCYQHDPERQEERKRNASKAGKSKPLRELQDVKKRLSDLARDVLEGRENRASAAVAGQLLNTDIRAVSVELKAKEQQDLEQRLEELEELLEARKGERRGYA
ncbi:MAG: DUF5763 domain-containing protein [Actinomycetota bacterium]|jgi:hypothetical protein|nr:DUF5763 domain-containing protein [Actinomycetota bacterium]